MNVFKKTFSILAMATLLISCGSSNQSASKTTEESSSNRPQRGQEMPDAATIIQQMDANKDGKLSLEEVKGPLKNDFSKIDTNEDGFLSKEEIEKAPKPQRSPNGSRPGGRSNGGR
ncbi:MAG: hypothetical protein ACSHWW_11260 [Nonlabens sp.]|uniref:hypothetical protein n=1 Tax=Nonlabens sp. TaxID=1888209 RepID=UPI003EF7C0BA